RTWLARRAVAGVRERRRHAPRDRPGRQPRGRRQPVGRGQPAGGTHHRAPQHRVRATGQRARDSWIRAASAADDGAWFRGGTARRIVGIKRQFNLLAGWTREEDTLPDRFLDTPLPTDPAATLSRDRLEELVAEYHRQRGW